MDSNSQTTWRKNKTGGLVFPDGETLYKIIKTLCHGQTLTHRPEIGLCTQGQTHPSSATRPRTGRSASLTSDATTPDPYLTSYTTSSKRIKDLPRTVKPLEDTEQKLPSTGADDDFTGTGDGEETNVLENVQLCSRGHRPEREGSGVSGAWTTFRAETALYDSLTVGTWI